MAAPSRLHYESGTFQEVLRRSKNYQQIFFSAFFTCDPLYIDHFISEQVKGEIPADWLARLVTLKCVFMHCHGEHDAANRQIKQVKKALRPRGDKLDDFYLSLARYLDRLAQTDRVERVALTNGLSFIGDSHLVSISHVIDAKSETFTYLPGLTLRGLSAPYPNSYRVALLNAVCMQQRRDHVLFSLGEIDQRFSYGGALENLRGNYELYLEKLYLTMEAGLGHVAALRCPYQTFYLMALPAFNTELLPAGDHAEADIEIVKNHINEYARRFIETGEALGFVVVGKEQLTMGSPHHFLLDHAHFSPSLYQSVLSDLA